MGFLSVFNSLNVVQEGLLSISCNLSIFDFIVANREQERKDRGEYVLMMEFNRSNRISSKCDGT